MKKLNILLLALFAALFIISCDKDDVIETDIVGFLGPTTVSGNVTLRTFGTEGVSDVPGRERVVFLGEELTSDIDTFIDVITNEIFFGDGWLATRTDGEGNYTFTDIDPFENWQLHVIENIDSIVGVDVTPDGDQGEELVDAPINISVLQNEVDDGNNFILNRFVLPFTEISGNVSIDRDGDGQADDDLDGVEMRLFRTDETGNPGGFGSEFIFSTFTDSIGNYSFHDLAPGNYSVLFGDQDTYNVVESGDVTPDDDPTSLNPRYIPAFIDEGEVDDGNNFLVATMPFNITGNVVIDTFGGLGAINQRIELYARNSEGVPMAPLVASINTDNDGFFYFGGLTPSDYVLYYIGNGDFTCLSGTDITPETGEPESPTCWFIPVDIDSVDDEDGGNIFIVE